MGLPRGLGFSSVERARLLTGVLISGIPLKGTAVGLPAVCVFLQERQP